MTPGSGDYALLVGEFCARCRRGERVVDALCDLGFGLLRFRVAFVAIALLRGKARRLPAGVITATGKPTKKARR